MIVSNNYNNSTPTLGSVRGAKDILNIPIYIMHVYAILAEGDLVAKYFNTFNEALDEVKRMYPEWDDRYDEDGEEEEYALNMVDVEEGHKIDKRSKDENLTELYIEKGIHIYIRKLVQFV